MKKIIFTFAIVFFSITSLLSQPFILTIHPDIDTLDYFQSSDSVGGYNITAEYLQRIDLTTNETIDVFKDSVVIYNVIYLVKDSLALIVQETVWSIYDIYNNRIVQSFPAPYDCMIDAVLINNSIYGFSCDDTEYGDFKTKIFLMDLQNNSLLFLCKIPFCGFDLGVNCSTNGDIHFQIEDTNYIPYRYDLTKLVSFSTTTNQFVNQTNLSTLGHQGANGYILYKGHNGIAIIESYFNDDVLESYFKAYDFNNNTGSNFIFHQGDVTPTISIDNKYLILSETSDSAAVVYNTGNLYVYDINTTNLVKTFSLPPWGNLYTFDNFPNNIYYIKNIELAERQIFVLKMDSIFNELDLEGLEPDTVNINSPNFTLTVKGKGFDTLTTVYFNGQEKLTTFISDSIITAEIPASDLNITDSFPVWVTDAWGVSDTLQFVVKSPNVFELKLNEITPAMSMKNNPAAFTMELNGSGFSSSSTVYFNGNARATTYVSDSTITTTILATDVTTVGNFPVWVSDGTTNSDTLVFKVVNNLPNEILPIMNCVTNNGNGTYTAYFGYNNKNSVSVFLAVYAQNKISPDPWDRGQPGVFKVGVQEKVFSVTWTNGNIIWHLNNKIATAKISSPPCQ